ncbi:tripartite motif-containing protein 60-like [Eleutherodactylus coqui]|uniref:tripartite motif-containing protein 60-like n=1 Tax=Eleutherodactylus coqui TaxID=57060 RepID=UPI0034624B6C
MPTYCLQYPSPAVKACLHCESFLCAKHLEVHSKQQEHSLDDVTSTLQNRICSTHCEILKFFCLKEKTLICTSCLTGDHRGHAVELLEVASCQRREELQKIMNHMHTEVKTLKKKANCLKEVISRNKEAAKELTAVIRSLCCGLLNCMREAAANVAADIKLQEAELFKKASDEIVSLEIKEEQLSEEIRQIEAMCNQDDLVLLLQNKLHPKLQTVHHAGLSFLDVRFDFLLVFLKLEKSFKSLAKSLPMQLTSQCLHIKWKVDVLLNSSTASNYLRVSANRKAVTYRSITSNQNKPKPGQFKTSHVLSELAFSSGRHYWEVKVGKKGVKSVGVAYPSIMKNGLDAFLGYNKQSWCLTWSEDCVVACYNSECREIEYDTSSMSSVAVCLDYDLGTLSFYRICSPVELLFAFRNKFTQPLHAAFYVVNSWIKINP